MTLQQTSKKQRLRRLKNAANTHGPRLVKHAKTAVTATHRAAKRTIHVAKQTSQPIIRGAKVAHYHTAQRPHAYIIERWSWYRTWHGWRWHKVVHLAILGVYVFLVSGIVIGALTRPVFASSTWAQTNWDQGTGTSTTNQYNAATNIDTSTANQLQLSRQSNKFTNSTFDSNITGWNGFGNSHDTSQSYSASGSAKITGPNVNGQHFTQTATYNTASTYPFAQDGGDINGDGREDLAIAHYGNTTANVSYAITNSDGTLGSFTTLNGQVTNPMDIRAADLNNDGFADLVVSYWTAQYISVFLNNGSGGFTTSTTYTVQSGSGGIRQCGIDLGRINSDTYLDIAVTCSGIASLYTFINTGSGAFNGAANILALTNTPSALNVGLRPALGDLNGDSKDEVVIPAYATCSFDYFSNDGSGTLTKQNVTLTTCGTSGMQNYTADVFDTDNDGKDDIILPRYSGTGGTGNLTNYLTVFKGTSGGIGSQTDTTESATAIGNAQRFEHADINGDGYQDFALAGNSSSIRVFMNNGNSTFTKQNDPLSGNSAIRSFTFIDIDGNGKKDIASGLFTNSTTSTLFVIQNNSQGGTLTQPINIGNTDVHQLEAYVYKDGTQVTSSDAELYSNGRSLTTSFSSTSSPGWYKLTATITGVNAKRGFGVLAKQGKTIYVDNVSLYRYESSGYLTSAILDPGYGGDWGVLSYSTTIPGSTQVKVRTSSNSDMSGATAFGSCSAISSGADISNNSCVTDGYRYIQYEVTLTQSSGNTPVFTSFSLEYDAYDIIGPTTNASSLSMKKASGGASVSSNGWTNGASPYFEWTAGADNAGGSGLLGYCVYLGTDNTADPTTTKGLLGTSPVNNNSCPFIVSGTSLNLATAGLLQTALSTSSSPYYLRMLAVDVVGNVTDEPAAQFQFRFDNTPASNPGYVSAPSQFINTKTVTLTWPSSGTGAPADSNSGLAGLQYKINNSTWYGDSHTGDGDIDDLLSNDGSYTTISSPDFSNLEDGINTVYFRAWDNAGNVSTSYVSAAVKINTSGAPSEPQNVSASPTTNTTNSFAFEWNAPATFNTTTGEADKLRYCYTVNTTPTANNCTFTDEGVTELTAGAFATQPGANTFYVVAKDDFNAINYSSYASTTFTANTAAPGIPNNIDVADVSVKATSNWRLAVTWDAPSDAGAGINSYRIYRSTGGSYSQVGTSSSTSFVDGSLSQVQYSYKVKACDSANNCGAETSVASKTPTGKFTSPAGATSEPAVSAVTTKRATIRWSTDRNSDSKIAIGTSSGEYSQSEVGNSNQVTSHEISLDNLAAGTTYYFKAKWTDEDGNTGSSQEYSFKTAPAPVLKEVNTLAIGLSNATIQFTVKDAVKIDLNYGKSDSFGGIKSINTSSQQSTYDIDIDGIDDGTKYFYRLTMYDSEGGTYTSSIFSFTTPPRPQISNLRFQPISGEPTSTQKVTWETNVPTDATLQYGKIGSNGTNIQNSEIKTSHEIIIRSLQDESEYFLLAQSRDASGNLAVSDRQTFKTALDTRPPAISEVVIEPTVRGSGAEARGQIVVSWKTDEPSTSQVAFAEGSNVKTFNNRTAEDAQLTTEHLVIVSDLPPSKVYSISPESRDKARNLTAAPGQAAIIERASDSVLNIVLNTLRKAFGL